MCPVIFKLIQGNSTLHMVTSQWPHVPFAPSSSWGNTGMISDDTSTIEEGSLQTTWLANLLFNIVCIAHFSLLY